MRIGQPNSSTVGEYETRRSMSQPLAYPHNAGKPINRRLRYWPIEVAEPSLQRLTPLRVYLENRCIEFKPTHMSAVAAVPQRRLLTDQTV